MLGIFGVSVLHNIVHLLFGVAGIAMAHLALLVLMIGLGVVLGKKAIDHNTTVR